MCAFSCAAIKMEESYVRNAYTIFIAGGEHFRLF